MEKSSNLASSEIVSCSSTTNRITGLPIDLLHHILSFIPTKYVVKTCLLSKEWKNIWRYVPALYICDEFDYNNSGDHSTELVDNVLVSRDDSYIQKLCVLLDVWYYDLHKINEWIIYAIRHKVQFLDIDDPCSDRSWSENDDSDTKPNLDNRLTPHIFTCESLRELKLHGQIIQLPPSIHLPRLTILHFSSVNVSDGRFLKSLSSATPSLESLILEGCKFQKSKLITICAAKLVYLKISFGRIYSTIRISAPDLTFLDVEKLYPLPLRINVNGSLMCLDDVNIEFLCCDSVLNLFCIVKNVRKLSLNLSYFPNLPSAMELQNDSFQFCNLKWLKTKTIFSDTELTFIHILMKISPKIESVILVNRFSECHNRMIVENYDIEMAWSNLELRYLNLVEFQDFKGSENEVNVLKFFLDKAILLKKLVIKFALVVDNQDMKKFGSKLMAYQPASPSVQILFGY